MKRHATLGLVLAAANCALVAIYLADHALGIPSWTVHRLFDLDGEGTIPAWYSSALLLLAGACFLSEDGGGSADAAPPPKWFFSLLGLGLIFLSADEIVGIHESITASFRDIRFLPRFSGNHGVWIPIYLTLGAAFFAATLRSWLALWRGYRRGILYLAGGVAFFLIGGVGVEIVSYGEPRGRAPTGSYVGLVALEEGLEMFGATGILLGSLLMRRGNAVGR